MMGHVSEELPILIRTHNKNILFVASIDKSASEQKNEEKIIW